MIMNVKSLVFYFVEEMDAVAVGMAQVCKAEVGGSNPPGIANGYFMP